jgi:Lecithin retinol acyltransferase
MQTKPTLTRGIPEFKGGLMTEISSRLVLPGRRLRIGSHIKVSRPGYYHHGIYEGRWLVIHYAGLSSSWIKKGQVSRTSLKEFARGSEIELVVHENALSKEEIISNARSRLDEDDYGVFSNNCEHFATWCATGNSQSKQVQAVMLGGLLGLQIHNLIEL